MSVQLPRFQSRQAMLQKFTGANHKGLSIANRSIWVRHDVCVCGAVWLFVQGACVTAVMFARRRRRRPAAVATCSTHTATGAHQDQLYSAHWRSVPRRQPGSDPGPAPEPGPSGSTAKVIRCRQRYSAGRVLGDQLVLIQRTRRTCDVDLWLRRQALCH